MDMIRRDVQTKAEVSGDRRLRFVMSDDSVDRAGDRIEVEGWKMPSYSPPVLLGHDWGMFNFLPVGKVVNVYKRKTNKHELIGEVEFATKEMYEYAETAFQLAKGGFIQTGSVGFRPIKHRRPTEEEQKELGMKEYGTVFEEQELLEFSLVPVPANGNAIQEALTKGLVQKEEVDSLPVLLDRAIASLERLPGFLQIVDSPAPAPLTAEMGTKILSALESLAERVEQVVRRDGPPPAPTPKQGEASEEEDLYAILREDAADILKKVGSAG